MISKHLLSRFLAVTKNAEVHQIQRRAFMNHYDHWFKIDEERNARAKRKAKEEHSKRSTYEQIKLLYEYAANETNLYFKELKDRFKPTKKILLEHGDYEHLFKFNSQEVIDRWQVNTDAGYNIGHSTASFSLTAQHTGLFHGVLSEDFDRPEQMKAMYTGYANIRSKTNYRSFRRVQYYEDYNDYTCFLLRFRGDGRNYAFTLSVPEYYTVTHAYMYAMPLYTHGGPYWQIAKIPFSKFFKINYGRLVDKQERMQLQNVRNFGFSCMDGKAGPFSLELDFLGVLKDNETTEHFAYETYKLPKYIANT